MRHAPTPNTFNQGNTLIIMLNRQLPRSLKSLALAGSAALLLTSAGAWAADPVIKPYFQFKKAPMVQLANDISLDTNGAQPPVFNAAPGYLLGFEGVSQYDGASLGRNAIPPDTMGAVGRTQYMVTTNGAYAVYNKTDGTRLSLLSDSAFWISAGQTGTNGDTRLMYNADASRWVMVAFGSNVKDLNVAVSDTDNALGPWKSVKFEGYAGLGFGGTADYPTLALDKNAVYIGTNNFAPATSGGVNSFRGTTMNVLPLNDLFKPDLSAPSAAGLKQFVTPFTGGAGDVDRGFAQQGVNNNRTGSSTGKVVAASAFLSDNLAFNVNGLSPTSAAAATVTAPVFTNAAAFTSPGAARQPSVAIPANRRIVDALDERLSSSVYEVNGRIYTVMTVNSGADPLDEARVRWTVLDSNTFSILAQGDIGQAGFDYYQGSIAVNADGQVVIGYNRSGLDSTIGKISFMAQSFNTAAGGALVPTSGELLLKVSLTDDYHNGSGFGLASSGRQRWGDYSQVSIDPSDPTQFYLIGQFAREYNNAAGGHPGGTGGSRWSTWVAVVGVTAVPEPSTWLMMIMGFAAVGLAARRRQLV